MQQNQIIYGVLTGYCCCKRPPFWISDLNGFCASTHHVTVRHYLILVQRRSQFRIISSPFLAAARYLEGARLEGARLHSSRLREWRQQLSFKSTLANLSLLSFMISTEAASATVFMNSTDALVNDRSLLSPDVENVTCQGLVVTSDNRCCLLFPIQPFHLGLEIKIAQVLLVPLWIRAI